MEGINPPGDKMLCGNEFLLYSGALCGIMSVKTGEKDMGYRDEPEQPVYLVVAIIIGIIYVAAAVVCFLALTTNVVTEQLGKIITSLDQASLQALTRLYGYMILALLPSAIIFIANKAPIEMSTFLRVVLWIVGVLGMVALIYLFFTVSAQAEYEQLLTHTYLNLYSISWLRTSLIVSALGVIAINVMANFYPNFNPSSALGSFFDVVWEIAQGQISYILFTLLMFTTLPWAFLINPIAGVYVVTLLTTLNALLDSGN